MLVFKFLDRLARENRGASAIEYAVIAGLIALGIVGSLVTTKTSLNSVFGTASSQMGASSSGSSAGASTSPRADVWRAKTLTSQSTANTVTTYKYSDGSTAIFSKGTGGNTDTQLTTFDATGRYRTDIYLNQAGQQTYYQDTVYYDAARSIVQSQVYTPSVGTDKFTAGSPGSPTSVVFYNFNTAGAITSNGTRPPTSSDINASQAAYYDIGYFKDLSNGLK